MCTLSLLKGSPAEMQIRIDERLRSHIPALKPDEYLQLEQNILAHGCQSPLIAWGDILLDGHNRYEICNRHGVPFRTETVNLPDFEAATAWIEENQLGRRNLTTDQFFLLHRPEIRTLEESQRRGSRKPIHGASSSK